MNLLFANDTAGQYPASYYAATATDIGRFQPLSGDRDCDVCIVGGGFTGLSAALHLAERGMRVILLEAHRVGFGASGRNGGQVGTGQRQDQDWLEKTAGKAAARQLWDLSLEAVGMVKDLVQAHKMTSTFHPGIAHACWTEAEVAHSHAYAEKLSRDYGYDQITPLDRAGLAEILPGDVYRGGDIDRGAGHLHPLNYALGLASAARAAGAHIHEETLVTRIEQGARPLVHTAKGKVRCDHLILACNGYLGDLNAHVASRVMPINNFVIATEPLGDRAKEVLRENVAVADTKFVVNYWRLSEDQRLLFGGCESYGYRFPDIAPAVRKPMLKIYPQLRDVRIDYAWGGTLAITVNRMPCFTRPAANILSASGYSGHGVAMATLAGRLLAEATAGQAERFDVMASIPIHRFPGGPALRWPLLVLAMSWYSLRDRLGL
ncbi:MAG: FAD-binding oxidoreductase [Paracoccaceae bacterium]